jgi:CRISPR-associated endoribonuclease Cas6
MPIATVLHSVLSEELDASKITGEALHGLFFAILAQKDKRLAGQLHKAAVTKPFTLALLNRGKKSKFKPGEELRMRVTLLDDSLFMKLADAFMNPQMELELQNARIIPTIINLSATDKGLWTGQQKWEEIYDSAGIESEIVLQFVTPTAFRQRDMDVPLPIPKLVFGSYLKRWGGSSLLFSFTRIYKL